MTIPSPSYLRPDTVLHIYYLQGRLPRQYQFPTPDFIGNWEEDGFSFLFFRAPADQEIALLLSGHADLSLLDQFEMTYESWQGGAITPLRVGRFLLNPPWIRASAAPGDISLTLDAGVVFGNGTHPTTLDCLTAMEIALAGHKVDTMLDLGCGTGILALAAAKLGCGRILAVDFNGLAARTTLNNVRLNNLSGQILPIQGKAEDYTAIATDLLVANIHYEVMAKIVRSDGFLRQKWFILSGLLRSEAAQIADFLASQPVVILKRWDQEVWHTFLGITLPQ